MPYKLIIAGIVGIIFVAVLIELWLKRGKPTRPLAVRMRQGMSETAETKKPLGMEATDLESVERTQRLTDNSALRNIKVKFK